MPTEGRHQEEDSRSSSLSPMDRTTR